MAVSKVAIVGRPNVGKSSLFNWLAGRRLAIVDDKAGVTRDRMTHLIHEHDRYFELIDTGGIGIEDEDNLTAHIEEQIQAGIDSADLLLFVVDTKAGLTPLDQEVSKRLRYVQQPIICVANKTDGAEHEPSADEFYRLGRGKVVKVSVLANRGRSELLNEIVRKLPPEDDGNRDAPDEAVMKLAIVGRRNTGKSTLVNTLAKAERMIVSEVAGTTRDSVDVRFELDGKPFTAIDTPGLRRAKSRATDLEFYSTHRAQRSIRRADVVLMFFDASQRISKVDKQLCDYIARQYKPCVFVVNKWDLCADTMPTERWANYLRDTFRTMWYVPIAFVTAQTGKNVKALVNHAQMLFKQSRERVATAELNRLVHAAVDANQPPLVANRRPKVYYATQVAVQPPTVVLFTNFPSGFSPPYQRYLLGVFRERLPFAEVPIKLYLRKRPEGAEGSEDDGESALDHSHLDPDTGASSESILD